MKVVLYVWVGAKGAIKKIFGVAADFSLHSHRDVRKLAEGEECSHRLTQIGYYYKFTS